jgi:hypothetical protein
VNGIVVEGHWQLFCELPLLVGDSGCIELGCREVFLASGDGRCTAGQKVVTGVVEPGYWKLGLRRMVLMRGWHMGIFDMVANMIGIFRVVVTENEREQSSGALGAKEGG